jgi:anti-sigma B factor antagonist
MEVIVALKADRQGDIAIVAPRGNLVGGNETVELETLLRTLGDEGNLKLVIDLDKVELLTSRPLGVLVAAHANYTRRGGRIALCNVDTRIRNILVITQLVKVFDVHYTRDGALSSF